MPREFGTKRTYHVTARINRSEMLLSQRDFYKTLFLEYVQKAKTKYTFSVRGLCIMGNHVHLKIKPAFDRQLSNIMQSILGGFARRYNIINGLKGHVWYDRFKSKIIHSYRQFFNTYLYIANNPVRANIVSNPLEYEYSGFTLLFSESGISMKKRVRELLSNIVDPPGLKVIKEVKAYLVSYSQDAASVIDNKIGFYGKKPGRPRNS